MFENIHEYPGGGAPKVQYRHIRGYPGGVLNYPRGFDNMNICGYSGGLEKTCGYPDIKYLNI